MTSTALDAALFVLLVGASVGTVATAPVQERPDDGGEADAVATTLATTTAAVDYAVVPAGETRGEERTERGTLAALLADAAVGRTRVDGRRIAPGQVDLVRKVRRAVEAAVGTHRTQVVAVWRPYPGAPVEGRVSVGSSPPPRADVHASRLAVARPARSPSSTGGRVASRSYDTLARVVATRTVAVLFPERSTGVAVRSDDPDGTLVRSRYARVAAALGADIEVELRNGDATAANRVLAAALRRRIATDLRRAFDSPAAAERATRAEEVRIVVRRWRP